MRSFSFLLLFLCFNTFAETSYFFVDDVVVKVTDKNSLEAKRRALDFASRKAFNKLVDQKFSDMAFFKNKISLEKVKDCVYDYSIKKEKFSSTNYIAKFSFRFLEDEVLSLLKKDSLRKKENVLNKNIIVIYSKNYFKNYENLKNCTVKSFSKNKVVLEVSAEQITLLKNLKFEKIDAKISS